MAVNDSVSLMALFLFSEIVTFRQGHWFLWLCFVHVPISYHILLFLSCLSVCMPTRSLTPSSKDFIHTHPYFFKASSIWIAGIAGAQLLSKRTNDLTDQYNTRQIIHIITDWYEDQAGDEMTWHLQLTGFSFLSVSNEQSKDREVIYYS